MAVYNDFADGNDVLTGKIKKWFPESGYGFIEPSDGGKDLFCLHAQLAGRSEGKNELNVGENVTYILGVNPKTGEPCAENVKGDGTGTRVEPIKSLEPCYSFQNGNCTRGNRCRFSHGGGGYGGRGGGFGRGRGGYGAGFGRGRGGYGGGWGYGGGYGGFGGYGGGFARGRGRGRGRGGPSKWRPY